MENGGIISKPNDDDVPIILEPCIFHVLTETCEHSPPQSGRGI